jgi:hypothetical protein
MPYERHFTFEINDLDDVTDHLDSLWYEFNQLAEALERQPCTNPPDTCGSQEESVGQEKEA